MGARRALHFVFKVGDRARTARFYRELLGMSVSAARGAGELSGSAALSPEETPRAVGEAGEAGRNRVCSFIQRTPK